MYKKASRKQAYEYRKFRERYILENDIVYRKFREERKNALEKVRMESCNGFVDISIGGSFITSFPSCESNANKNLIVRAVARTILAMEGKND